MKNKGRLGKVPKGLSWINDQEDQQSIQNTRDEQTGASEQGLTQGWTRATFIITKEHLDKIKDLAWWERATIKQVMHDALKKYLEDKNINPRKKSELLSEEL